MSATAPIEMFKAARTSKRFNANQKVFVSHRHDNHMEICFRWRGKGRWTRGTIDTFTNTSVGPIRTIDVAAGFAQFIQHGGNGSK